MLKGTDKESVQEAKYLPHLVWLVSYGVLIDFDKCLPFLPYHTSFSVVGAKMGVSRHNMYQWANETVTIFLSL